MPGSTSIERYQPSSSPDFYAFIAAMWLLYCQTPGQATAPGEPVDLGEIGSSPEKSWERLTPYSPAQVSE
jgi:hypothetical protein